jgi:hypothetical protein
MPRSSSAAVGALSITKATRLPQVPSNEQLLDKILLNDLEISIIDRYETPAPDVSNKTHGQAPQVGIFRHDG